MSNAGASIEAVLTLNSTGFTEGISQATTALNKFANATDKLNKANTSTAMRGLADALNQVESSLQQVGNISKANLNTFSKLSNAINNMAKGLRTLQSDAVNVDQAVNTMNSIFKAFQGSLSSVEVKVKGVSTSVKELTNTENQSIRAMEQYKLGATNVQSAMTSMDNSIRQGRQNLSLYHNNLKQLALGVEEFNAIETSHAGVERQVASASNQASSSIQRQSSAMNRASGSANRMNNSTKALGKSLSSLRMMGTMVGSMIAYNFVHNLAMATTETINAKSEMNGYFQMLGYTTRQTEDFNKALDKTVQKFPRLNKYALGETISSIGVEFELTTKEMKKAMPVVSMITSEYLRAGRNVNEASLAVKDILQGEFQRLSRETGVKGDQLKEAGWSGDKKDVMGLLKALEKVGKERNWDTFVMKANSLNDAVLILQNRFSEWSADMVERIQPTIVSVFNMIMGTAQKFANVLTGAMDWLGGSGIENQIAKWGLLATAIGVVGTALISYRTGANLLQIAQMGLTKSILATTLGLNGETTAYYGVRTAIFSKIFGLEAEKVAELSVKQAIASKVLGLDAELVAQRGIKQGIIDSAFARELEALRIKGATQEELLNTLALYENNLAQKSSIGILSAQLLKLDMNTYATHGFTVALLENTTALKGSRIATMNWIQKLILLGTSIAVPTAIVGAFAVAVGSLAWQMKTSADEMKDFNDLIQNGDSLMKDARSTVKEYTDRQESLKKKLSEAKEGTQEYYEIQDKLRATNQDLITSNENLENTYKALQVANSAQKHYEEKLNDIAIDKQHDLAKAYMDAGYSATEAYEMANDSLIDANNGAEQLRITLQKIAVLSYKGEQNINKLLAEFEENNVDKDVGKKYLTEAERLNSQAQKGLEKGMSDDSFMGRMDGWFSYYESQFRIWLNNVGAMFETNDWGAIWENVWKGIAHGFADLPIAKDFWGWIYDQLGVTNYAGQGWDAFGNIFNDLFTWMFDPSRILDNQDDPLKNFIEGLLNNSDPLGWVQAFEEWANSVFSGFDLGAIISNAFANGGESGSGGGMTAMKIDPLAFLKMIFPDITYESMVEYVNNNIILPFSYGIINGIANIPIIGSIAQMLGLVPSQNENAHQTGYNLIDHLRQGVEQKISEIPIIGDIASMLGLIPSQNQNAHDKGHGIGSNIKEGERQGHQGTADNVRTEMGNIINAISSQAQNVYNTAHDIGSQIINGIKNAMDMHSPSIISRELMPQEFGVNIPNAILSAGQMAYDSAYQYGQQITNGISATNFNNLGFDTAVGEYQNDAQIVADSSYMMGTTTTTAFNDMTNSVNASTNQMQGNVTSSYSQMQQSQSSLLNNMKQSNTTAYNEMYLKSNQSLLQMRDSTSNVTSQMTQAWSHMKDQIVASANQLKSESTSHFSQLSNTIGDFYRKIQNPSNWGAGAGSGIGVRGARHPSAGKGFARMMTRTSHHGAGSPSPYSKSGSRTMTLRALKHMICPTGNCDIFNGLDLSKEVDVDEFLSMIGGEHGFGWGDWSGTHLNHIKNTSNQWSMKSPTIQLAGGIPTNANYRVGDFANGTPKISFSSFQSMAESIFSTIPYKFYYDSNWKGSWLGALQAGACNCSDGADALVAFAHTCGFDAYKQHGTWTNSSGQKFGHFWAVVNGKKMDTTGWQYGYGWSPSNSGAGSPVVRRATPNSTGTQASKVINVTNDFSGAIIYGVDDLDDRIKQSTKEALREEINDPFSVPI